MANRLFQVGITGGIGSGKSIVSKVFGLLGVPVYDADSRAKLLMATDPILKKQITNLLGAQAYRDQEINRAWISKRVFSDRSLLDQLNGLVHPKVGSDYLRWIASNTNEPIIIKEAALMYETGLAKQMDKVIVVSAPETLRISRVVTRDIHRSKSDVEAIIGNQLPEAEKIAQADFVVTNDESVMIIPQVLKIHHELLAQF